MWLIDADAGAPFTMIQPFIAHMLLPCTWIHPLGVFFSFFRTRGDGSPGRDGLSLGSVLCFGSVQSGTQLGRLIGLPEVELLSATQEDGSYVGVSRPATDAA